MKSLTLLLLFSCTIPSFAQNTISNSTDLSNAEAFFYLKKYRKALYYYASVAKDTNQHYAIGQVALIHAIIDSNKRLLHEQHLNEIIALADSTFEIGNYLSAADLYKRTLLYSPALRHPKERLTEINLIHELKSDTLSDSDKELAHLFKKLVNKADSEFDKKKYDRAYNFYKRALAFSPDNSYARQMLKTIDDITSEIKK
ncbi:MAG: tetratricopeptide (TPR) repeat protein [Crocinitomix sp.]|jgi:tetratricopeptide (TPR) repeat protein